MTRRAIATAVLTAAVGSALSGCFLDDGEEACGSLESSAAVAGCVDTSEPQCVGRRPSNVREIRVDSYDIRLPSGGWVRSEGADFDADPPLVALALSDGSDNIDRDIHDLAVGQTIDSAGETFRVVYFCDTGVTWLVPT